jgi:hypothetical protein
MVHANAIASGADAKAVSAELAAENLDDLGIVINHQQMCRRNRG